MADKGHDPMLLGKGPENRLPQQQGHRQRKGAVPYRWGRGLSTGFPSGRDLGAPPLQIQGGRGPCQRGFVVLATTKWGAVSAERSPVCDSTPPLARAPPCSAQTKSPSSLQQLGVKMEQFEEAGKLKRRRLDRRPSYRDRGGVANAKGAS